MSFEITLFSCFCSGPIHTAENGGLFYIHIDFLHVVKTSTLKFTKYSKGVFV